MTYVPDPAKLDPREMASEMIKALSDRHVDVNLGAEGWRVLLEGISEGIINHLYKHDAALTIPSDTHAHGTNGGSAAHDHGGHVEVRRSP
jgi:hypothetical protein